MPPIKLQVQDQGQHKEYSLQIGFTILFIFLCGDAEKGTLEMTMGLEFYLFLFYPIEM